MDGLLHLAVPRELACQIAANPQGLSSGGESAVKSVQSDALEKGTWFFVLRIHKSIANKWSPGDF